jgi:diguanylate cyclase (GGDEF)-like protein
MSGNAHPLTDPDGAPVGVVAGMRDVTDLIAAQEALVEVATHDDLTGLFTRGEILERLAATLSHPPRSGGRVAVAFCDLDDLKTVNDRHGHGAGDEALRVTATRVRATVREGDLVARFGGDEILVILDCVHDDQDARTIAEKIRNAALLPIPILGGSFDVTLSIGITLAEPGDTIDSLIARADNAMYEAKATGKNQVVSFARQTD